MTGPARRRARAATGLPVPRVSRVHRVDRVAQVAPVALVALLAACAGRAPAPAGVAPQPIVLAPRCLDEAALPALGTAAAEPAGEHAAAAEPERLANGAFWLASAGGTASGLARLVVGFQAAWSARGPSPWLVADVVASGVATRDPDGLVDRRRAFGAGLSVTPGDGWLWLELQFPAAAVDDATAWLAEALDVAAPEREALERVRRRSALLRLAVDASPASVASRAFRALHPPVANALRPVAVGDPESATPEALGAFLEATLRPGGALFAYEGPDGADRARAAVASLSTRVAAALDGGDASPPVAAPRRAEAGAIHFVDRPGALQVELLVGHPTVGPRDADAVGLSMLASWLGGDVGGRLFRDLRERQGLAYVVGAEQHPEGRFVVSTRTSPDRIVALLAGVEAHLAALQAGPLAECERTAIRRRGLGELDLIAGDAHLRERRRRVEWEVWRRVRGSAERRAAVREAAERLDGIARAHLAGPPIVVMVGDLARVAPLLRAGLPDRSVVELDVR